jgi:hypothetical protein
MNTTPELKRLTDEEIREVALTIDKMIVEVGDKFSPSGIEFAAIVMGRMMVFSKEVQCHDLFIEMLQSIVHMASGDLSKTEDLKQESA